MKCKICQPRFSRKKIENYRKILEKNLKEILQLPNNVFGCLILQKKYPITCIQNTSYVVYYA